MTTRATLAAGIALGASLFLIACNDNVDTTTPDTVTPGANGAATGEDADGAETVTATATPEATDTLEATSPEAAEQPAGEDPVFSAIDAVLEQYAGGIIIDIDREDNSEAYEMDVVLDDQVIEVDVSGDGAVREDERETDGEDVGKANEATMTAADAIREALEQHPEGILDEAELDRDDGQLRWEIELDDADGRDLVELNLPAS